MTALAAPRGPVARSAAGAVGAPAATTLALGAVVLARWAAWRSAALDPIAIGALFGLALLALGIASGRGLARAARAERAAKEAVEAEAALPGRLPRSIALGAAAGVGLALTALLGPHPGSVAAYAAGFPIGPWAAATVLVAGAEELVLRGALFDQTSRLLGVPAAVVATSVAFGLMHVPVYGWQAVPLDVGVGLVLAGLRLVSGGVAAPAVAHAVADLAVAWL